MFKFLDKYVNMMSPEQLKVKFWCTLIISIFFAGVFGGISIYFIIYAQASHVWWIGYIFLIFTLLLSVILFMGTNYFWKKYKEIKEAKKKKDG